MKGKERNVGALSCSRAISGASLPTYGLRTDALVTDALPLACLLSLYITTHTTTNSKHTFGHPHSLSCEQPVTREITSPTSSWTTVSITTPLAPHIPRITFQHVHSSEETLDARLQAHADRPSSWRLSLSDRRQCDDMVRTTLQTPPTFQTSD